MQLVVTAVEDGGFDATVMEEPSAGDAASLGASSSDHTPSCCAGGEGDGVMVNDSDADPGPDPGNGIPGSREDGSNKDGSGDGGVVAAVAGHGIDKSTHDGNAAGGKGDGDVALSMAVGDVPLATATIVVEGMTCVSCANIIQRQLEHLPSVDKVQVSVVMGTASMEYDAAKVRIVVGHTPSCRSRTGPLRRIAHAHTHTLPQTLTLILVHPPCSALTIFRVYLDARVL